MNTTGSTNARTTSPVLTRSHRPRARRWIVAALVVALLVTLTPASGAQTAGAEAAPANDDFADAQVITGTSGTTMGTTVQATLEADEIAPVEPPTYNHSVWYSWTPTSSTPAQVSADGGPSVDLEVTVWTGPNLASLIRVSGDHTTGPAEVTVEAGTTYYIQVTAYTWPTLGNDSWGSFTLQWAAKPVVTNDAFGASRWLRTATGSAVSANHTATAEPGEPSHAGSTAAKSVWFVWSTRGAGNVVFDTVGSDFDTVLAVYTGNSVNSLTEVASNDDALGLGTLSRVSFNAVAYTTYWIAVDGFGGASGKINLNRQFSTLPANDDFSQAASISGATGSATGATVGATTEPGEPDHARISRWHGTSSSTWYRWTAPSSGLATFDTVGSSFDTTLAAYVGAAVTNLTELAANDEKVGTNASSEVKFVAEQGTTYHLAIAGPYGDAGTTKLNWTQTACAAHGLTDVPAWVSDAVGWATCLAFMSGYPNNTFGPNLPITRAQVASLLYKIAGSPPEVDAGLWPGHGLSDVPAWVEDPVKWMVGWGYATGYPNGTFRPNNNITRAEMARMLFRIAGEPTGSPANAFPDVPNWVDAAVDWLTDPARTPAYASGYPDGTFRPNNNITRAQTTRMTCRIHREPGTC